MDSDNTGFMRDRECLLYAHERLRVLLGDNSNSEHMRKLRGIIDNTPRDADSDLFMSEIDELKISDDVD